MHLATLTFIPSSNRTFQHMHALVLHSLHISNWESWFKHMTHEEREGTSGERHFKGVPNNHWPFTIGGTVGWIRTYIIVNICKYIILCSRTHIKTIMYASTWNIHNYMYITVYIQIISTSNPITDEPQYKYFSILEHEHMYAHTHCTCVQCRPSISSLLLQLLSDVTSLSWQKPPTHLHNENSNNHLPPSTGRTPYSCQEFLQRTLKPFIS